MPRALTLKIALLMVVAQAGDGRAESEPTQTETPTELIAAVETPAAPVAPAGGAADPLCADDGRYDFSKVPPTRPLSRPGMFPFPPTGPGYYSLLDRLKGEYREGPPKYPYPPVILSPLPQFDADWRFVDDPKYHPDFLERIKRIHVHDNWLLSTGGQMWFRYQDEYNSRLTETDNLYTLLRVRPYIDVWYKDRFRFFIEGIFADSVAEDLPPLITDVDLADFQNLFIELKLGEVADKPVYARIGRQEVNLGSLRLLAAPDWANARRTFQGARVYRTGEKWNADLFWLQPVIPNASELNSVDNNQNFAGAWVTYKPKRGTYIDAYYLMLDNTNHVTQLGIQRAPFTLHNIGGRYASDKDGKFLWETEGSIQLGRRGPADLVAGMFSGGLGYHAKDLPWNPTLWAVYNYCSGDPDPNVGDFNTFNQLFPFIHYYMGWVDAVGRQNLNDVNIRLYSYPTKWITLWLQYHHFWLAEQRDALYNIAGGASRRDPSGSAGRDIGQKAEIWSNFHLSKRTDLLLGYSYLWGGRFLEATATPRQAVNSGIFYVGCSMRW